MLDELTMAIMMQPILDDLEDEQVFILLLIAARLGKIANMKQEDFATLAFASETAKDKQSIERKINQTYQRNYATINKILQSVGEDSYKATESFFKSRGIEYQPFNKNASVSRIIEDTAAEVAKVHKSQIQTQAFMVRDATYRDVLIPTPLSNAYQKIIDNAVSGMTVQGGSYVKQIEKTVKDLASGGVKNVSYETKSGSMYVQNIDSAVRRNVLDGMRKVAQDIQDETGKQFGADGVELSVHLNPAPDHAPAQGHQFSMAEYEKLNNNSVAIDYTGERIQGFTRRIGTLNCRHIAYNIILGVNSPNNTKEQLRAILSANEKGYTADNGKKLTLYECSQKQRVMENDIRKKKRQQMALKAADNIDAAKKAQQSIDYLTKKYKSFSKACGLDVRNDLIRISGYKRI